MGTFNHQVVVIVGDREYIKEAHTKAKQVYPYTSEIIDAGFNSYSSFILGCDGSKEGWSDSTFLEDVRESYMEWLDSSKLYVHYAELSFHENLGYEPFLGRTSHTKYGKN